MILQGCRRLKAADLMEFYFLINFIMAVFPCKYLNCEINYVAIICASFVFNEAKPFRTIYMKQLKLQVERWSLVKLLRKFTIWLLPSPLHTVIDNEALSELKTLREWCTSLHIRAQSAPWSRVKASDPYLVLVVPHSQTNRELCLSAATDGRVESKDVWSSHCLLWGTEPNSAARKTPK